jgi:hypothetical protein
MACLGVVDGEDDLQIWMVAVNILNDEFRTAEMGVSSALRVRPKGNNPSIKRSALENFYKGLGIGRIPWNELGGDI